MTTWGSLSAESERRARNRNGHAGALAADVPVGCPLTPSQYGALRMLALGLTYKQMALASNCSVSNVRTHLHNVYTKLEVVDRAQAVLKAAEAGWLGEAVEFGDTSKADPLRGFAREYLVALDDHLADPEDAEANRNLACAAEGLGLGRTERTRETRNDFIDAVIDGMIGRRASANQTRGAIHA